MATLLLGLGASPSDGAEPKPPTAYAPDAGAAANSAGPAKVHLPPPATTVLGSLNAINLKPGTPMLKGSVIRLLTPEDAASWRMGRRRSVIDFGAAHFELVVLEYPGEAAAVVVQSGSGATRKIAGTYAVDVGGNGAEIDIVETRQDPSGIAGFALLKITKELKGYEDGKKHIDASSDDSFVVLGFTADQAWLATEDELTAFDTASLQEIDGTLRVIGCQQKRKNPRGVLVLDPSTALFRPASAAIGRQSTCPIDP